MQEIDLFSKRPHPESDDVIIVQMCNAAEATAALRSKCLKSQMSDESRL